LNLVARRPPLLGPSFASRPRAFLAAAAITSVLLHSAVIWALVPHNAARMSADQPATIEVEMVNQPPEQQGTPAVQPTQPPPTPKPTPPPVPQPPAPQPPPAPELPPEPKGVLSPAAPPATPQQSAPQQEAPPPPPMQQAPPGPPTPPASVNLGGANEDQEALSVTGDNVVPPRPDARIHNKPPPYPLDAVRRHAEGVVGVRIHVTENGTPGYVDVIHSSGDASLDRSVRDAVMLWRFDPARDHGTPIPFDYTMNFEFSMNRP
jgi:protein TonB